MKRLATLVILCAPCLLTAQQIALPPSSVQNGVLTHSAGKNARCNYWSSNTGLGAYRISGDAYQSPLKSGEADNQLGLVWNPGAPASFSAARQTVNNTGGLMRVIFIGETAGWLNDFGYTYSGSPSGQGAYTAWSQMQSYGCNPNIKFGDYFEIPLEVGDTGSLDFWFSANGGQKGDTSDLGGLYTLFGAPGVDGQSSHFLWADRSLIVNTWNSELSSSSLIDTYLISAEDWRLDRGSDRDYNDFRFAIQFLNTDGTALAVIPEPGHYAAFAGMAALLGVLLQRRRPRATERS